MSNSSSVNIRNNASFLKEKREAVLEGVLTLINSKTHTSPSFISHVKRANFKKNAVLSPE